VLVSCNIQFLTIVTGALPGCRGTACRTLFFGAAMKMKRVRLAVPYNRDGRVTGQLSKVRCYATLVASHFKFLPVLVMTIRPCFTPRKLRI
jgi:hypothetical protein